MFTEREFIKNLKTIKEWVLEGYRVRVSIVPITSKSEKMASITDMVRITFNMNFYFFNKI